MILRVGFPLLLLFSLATFPSQGQDKKPPAPNTNPAFEQFKRLVGEWVGNKKGEDGHDLRVKYKLTAGGSALVETIMPGSDHEMVTVIHPDGPDLLLTHYCMLGNQPHMRATPKADAKVIEFKFVKATNMKSDKDMHMREVTFTFVDNDTLRADWVHYKDGKSAGNMVVELKRKK
jgi:hypothetical protein